MLGLAALAICDLGVAIDGLVAAAGVRRSDGWVRSGARRAGACGLVSLVASVFGVRWVIAGIPPTDRGILAPPVLCCGGMPWLLLFVTAALALIVLYEDSARRSWVVSQESSPGSHQ